MSQLLPVVSIHDGKPVTTSLIVAEHFGKRHDNVLRDIDALLAQVPDSFDKLNFEEKARAVRTGLGFTRKERYFELTRDGFTLLAMGFTGAEALRWKVTFLDAFNRLEATLRADLDRLERLRAFVLAERPDWAKVVRYRGLGLSQREIGRLMGWPRTTVRDALRRLEQGGLLDAAAHPTPTPAQARLPLEG